MTVLFANGREQIVNICFLSMLVVVIIKCQIVIDG